MNPEADQILLTGADQLTTQIAPNLASHYLRGAAAVQALLMRFAAREYESGADIRATENADIRALFAELAPMVRDDTLKARLRAAAATRDISMTISALNIANGELRRLLIVLQIHVEEFGPRDAEKRIWKTLKAMAERRAISL